jgi:hypothetical protein
VNRMRKHPAFGFGQTIHLLAACSLVFLLVSPVGGPHSLRGVGRGDGGGREQ